MLKTIIRGAFTSQARHIIHKIANKIEPVCHIAYLGLVFMEAHGAYGVCAGVLAVVVVAEQFGSE